MNNTARQLSPAGHMAVMLMRDAKIKHQTRDEDEYLRAVEVIRAYTWETPEDEAHALQECSHWVGR